MINLKSLVLLAALFSTAAFATPTDKSLEELSKFSSYEAVFYDHVATPLMMERIALVENVIQDSSLTDEQRKKALETYDNYAEGLLKALDGEQTRTALKKAYLQVAKSNYTQGEVDAQIAFYGSLDGQNALQKQETVLSAYLQSAQQSSQTTIKNYQDKHLKKMQDELKKILKK
ncbi:MAG: hypothetical protein Q4A69_02445 [Moraxella sp.]|nr:hypothetical protein [Moraxella sp.]